MIEQRDSRLCKRCDEVFHTPGSLYCNYCQRALDAEIDRGTCIFPDDHAPGHPVDMTFHVYDPTQDLWVDWTEAEIYSFKQEFPNTRLMISSQFDWWWD